MKCLSGNPVMPEAAVKKHPGFGHTIPAASANGKGEDEID
jgi:hypothetical protein